MPDQVEKLTARQPTNGRKKVASGARQLPLFRNEPAVTVRCISVWLLAVPRMYPGQRGLAAYVRSFSVVDKIKATKMAGEWQEIERAALKTARSWLGEGLADDDVLRLAVLAFEPSLMPASWPAW